MGVFLHPELYFEMIRPMVKDLVHYHFDVMTK